MATLLYLAKEALENPIKTDEFLAKEYDVYNRVLVITKYLTSLYAAQAQQINQAYPDLRKYLRKIEILKKIISGMSKKELERKPLRQQKYAREMQEYSAEIAQANKKLLQIAKSLRSQIKPQLKTWIANLSNTLGEISRELPSLKKRYSGNPICHELEIALHDIDPIVKEMEFLSNIAISDKFSDQFLRPPELKTHLNNLAESLMKLTATTKMCFKNHQDQYNNQIYETFQGIHKD